MVADEFAVSHGSDQPVAVTADRKLDDLTLNYRIAGGAQTASVSEWEGGEKCGDTHDDFYAEFRGTVTGAARVTRWRRGSRPSTRMTGSYLFVEARTADGQDWTTLPDANGHT